MQRLLKAMVRAVGVGSVDAVESGQRALWYMQRSLPDILLVDWMMSGMTGIELVRRVRRSETSLNPYLPIIMVTGHADKEHIAEARNAGIHEFLAKPVSPAALAAHIHEIVERPRGFVRTPTYFGPERRRTVAKINRPERRKESTEFITPEQIQVFVEELRERMRDGPIERTTGEDYSPRDISTQAPVGK